MTKCAGITRAGTACKGIPIEGSQWCYAHHPDHTEERRGHGAKGGRRGGRGRPQTEIHAAKNKLWQLAEDTLTGEVDRSTAAVVAQVLNVYLKACTVSLDAQERLEILPRLEELETLLAARKENRWQA
jgi:hypothetical protein